MIEQTHAEHQVKRAGSSERLVLDIALTKFDPWISRCRLGNVLFATVDTNYVEPQFPQKCREVSDATADIGRSLQAEIPSKGFKQRSDGFLSCSNDLQGFSRVKNRSWKGAHRLPRMEKSEGMFNRPFHSSN